MIDYARDIQPLEADLSDSEIATHLSTKTKAPMQAELARDALLESGAVVIDPITGNRVGPLVDHYTSLSDGQDKVLLAWFINHVFGDGVNVETDQYPRSIQFAAVEGGLPADIAAVAQAIVASAGGRPDAGTAAGDVSSARELYLLEQQTQEEMQSVENEYVKLYNENIAPLIDANNSDSAAWQAALDAMATGWSS